MESTEFIDGVMEFISDNLQIILTAFFIMLFFIGKSIVRKIVRRHASKNNIRENRTLYTVKFVNVFLAGVILTLIAITWDVDFQGLSIYMASIFTVVGIAFFAQWSIISNITASVIIFFYYTYKMGNKIKIIDGDNSIVGKIIDITLFDIKIELDNGNIVSYPNSLALQKPILQYEGEETEEEVKTED